ncbi:MAG: protease inhibitor I42 family protein [Chloroflexota bacterium]
MKKWLYLSIGLLLALVTLSAVGCAAGKAADFTQEQSRDIAEQYVRNSPTFAFDGMEDSLSLAGNVTMRCPYCWAFEFEFQSSHAGYGDRTDQAVAQVITHHTAWITVHRGEVVEAVMDGVWDMMEQRMVDGVGEPVTEIFSVDAGETFTISLESNPSTGYGWTAHFDGQMLELVAVDYEASSELIGAGGIETFEFGALQEGDTTIVMVYERTWEEGYLQRAVYRVSISDGGS